MLVLKGEADRFALRFLPKSLNATYLFNSKAAPPVFIKQGSHPEILKIFKSGDIQVPLCTIQRTGHTFQGTGSVAWTAGPGRPEVTTTRDNRMLKMAVRNNRQKTLTK